MKPVKIEPVQPLFSAKLPSKKSVGPRRLVQKAFPNVVGSQIFGYLCSRFPIIGIMIFLVLYWGHLCSGNYHFQPLAAMRDRAFLLTV